MIKNYYRSIISFLSILFFAVFLFTGCEKKVEDQPAITTDTTKPESADSVEQEDTTTVMTADLKGKWSGTFDKRATTLNITEQDGNKFKGSITINYREVINQQVSGEINPDTKEISMKDLLHSRYAGRYNGKLSDDMTKMSGTFTMNVEGSKFNFSLNKK